MLLPWLVAALLPVVALLRTLYCLIHNIRAAKASGLRYVVVPIFNYNTLALVCTSPFFRLLDKIWPNPSPSSWRRLIGSAWLWKIRHAAFKELGTDSFLCVSPGGIILYTADADVVNQIISRDEDFPKAVKIYKLINLYGDNVVSSTGRAYRKHRRLTVSAFSETNNELVWKETMFQTQKMLAYWTGGSEILQQTIRKVSDDTMRLSLSVICRAALGQKMDLFSGSGDGGLMTEKDLPPGHSLTFDYSLQFLLSKLLFLLVFPRWLLRIFPSRVMKECFQASDEWGRYMAEMVADKRSTNRHGTGTDNTTMDMIGQFLKAEADSKMGKGAQETPLPGLTESDIIGNVFVWFIAGHETSANSIHFCLLLLAIHPHIQKKTQQDLDRALKGRPVSSLDYKRDFPQILNSLLGAVLSEQLRLITPVISIPKITSCPQKLTVEGEEVQVPGNTMIRISVLALHRNPHFWPCGPPKDVSKPFFPPSNPDNDLEEFKPERWLQTHASKSEEDLSTRSGGSTRTLYNPPRGAYLPFSAGQRACSGQRFAQVEILCALAIILSQYTVELAVDHIVTDAELAIMDETEKIKVWRRARDEANDTWQQKMQSVISLQIRGAHVPLRVVKRGSEVFRNVQD